MKLTLYYDFDEYTHDGPDSIRVKGKDFRYEIKLKKKDLNKKVQELLDENHDGALAQAAYNLRCQLAMCDGNIYY